MPGAVIVALGGLGWWFFRRRRSPAATGAEVSQSAAADTDVAAPVVSLPVAAATPPVMPAVALEPALALTFRPSRVGFNMLSATVEGELTIANDGTAAAENIRLRTALLSVHAGQDGELAAFAAETIGRPVVAPFALPAGQSRAIRVVVAAPREGLRTMTAGGRPMFVPVLAIKLVATSEERVDAYAVGIERADAAKLAPFWLDLPPRNYDQVAARPHREKVLRQRNG